MTPVQALVRGVIASLLVFAGSLSLNPAKAQPGSQTLTIASLRDRVTVRRDERGIPYIEAANDQDLYFAQGYITALKGSKNNVTAPQFATDAAAGKLPSVSWLYGPTGLSEHPVESVKDGQHWTAQQVDAVVKGGLWPNTVVFITWDDWGGWYDHVNPPVVEKWRDGTPFRYGSRVGCLVLSPYAKAAYISHALHSHLSLIKFCEKTFGLPPINARDRAADDMSDCFDFTQKPLAPPPLAV